MAQFVWIPKFTRDQAPAWDQAVYVTRAAGAALISLWQGTASPEQRHLAAQALGQARDRGFWLACGCGQPLRLDLPPENPPLLGVAQAASGALHLKRLTERGAHQTGCCFEFEAHENRPSPTNRSAPTRVTTPSFLLAAPDDAHLAGNRVFHEEQSSGGASRTDPLARRLFWLLERANMDRCLERGQWPGGPLRQCVSDVPIAHGLMLSQIVRTGELAVRNDWFAGVFERCRQAGLPPQAWWVHTVDEIDPKSRTLIFGKLPAQISLHVQGQLKVFGGSSAAARSPWLVIALVRPDNKGRFCLARAYLHPVYRKGLWILVDSDLERQALRTIENARFYLAQNHALILDFCKPITAVAVAGDQVRPDFLLSIGARTMVIETMGSDDPEYRQSKLNTHSLMRQIGPLYLDERCALDRQQADRALNRAVIAWALRGRF